MTNVRDLIVTCQSRLDSDSANFFEGLGLIDLSFKWLG
jgi:hypothetical protein